MNRLQLRQNKLARLAINVNAVGVCLFWTAVYNLLQGRFVGVFLMGVVGINGELTSLIPFGSYQAF